MILLTPLERSGAPGWTQTRVEAPSGGGALAQLSRLLARLGDPARVAMIAEQTGRRALWLPGQSPEFCWEPDPSLAPWIADSQWRQDRLSAPQAPLGPSQSPPELCWLWSPKLRRWETPLFLLAPDSQAPRLKLSFQAAASLLYLWDADALWLSGEWGRELRAADLIALAQPMSAEGMRRYGRECFGGRAPDFEPAELARWKALQEAKDIEEATLLGQLSEERPWL